MKKVESTLKTTLIMDDKEEKLFQVTKVWDTKKKSLAVCLLKAGTTTGVGVDKTTQLILKNAEKLDFGSVTIVNVIAKVNGNLNKQELDEENLKYILNACEKSDMFVYAAGTAVLNNRKLLQLQSKLMENLIKHKEKIYCLGNDKEPTFFHVLYPAVQTWKLYKFNPALFVELPEQIIKKSHKKKEKIGK